MSWGYIFESRINRKMQSLFGQYVPPSLVDIMAQDPDKYSMVGRNATLTILFTDVRGFSSISESMNPSQLAEMMNELNDAMTEIIRRYSGTLDKYIGDAIMAFWGAPVEDRQHARNAILSALEMQAVLVDVNRSFVERGWTALRIGIGVNSGLVTVGDMGSKVRRSYTVIGNSVNLASRIEGLNKYYQAWVIVGEDTYSLAPEFAYRFLDMVRVKGIEKPVAIYEPLGEASALPVAVQEELRIWQQALAHYRLREWAACKQLVCALVEKNPHCAIYSIYLDRLSKFISDPPGDAWSPVVRHDT
jgi:adenylate cyclase